ncbi:MAG: ATP-dependent helicase [Candidatus Eisenbacteria bacterium]|nr:ATP-dependent helicase [Candidatus Eisenbacteria bacterium]
MTPRRRIESSRTDYRACQKLQAALRELELGRDKVAVKKLRSIIRKHPDFAPAVVELRLLCLERGWHGDLLLGLRDAYNGAEWDPIILEDLVTLSVSLQLPRQALGYLFDFRMHFPRRRKIGRWWIRDLLQWAQDAMAAEPEQGTPASSAKETAAEASAKRPSVESPAKEPAVTSRAETPSFKSSAETAAAASAKTPSAKTSTRQLGPKTSPVPAVATSSRKPAPKPSPEPAVATILPRPQLGPLQVTMTVDGPDLAERLAQEEWNTPPHHELCLAAHHLAMVNGIDELLCLSNLNDVRELWYQIETVRKVLRRFRGRALLCDEVGLGKTIEAGMVIKEYMLRGLIRSVLILVPPSLVAQWREELLTKFGIDCATSSDAGASRDPEAFWREQPMIIASLALAKSQRNAPHLTARQYDLIIVDEAHHLRNRTTQAWKLVNRLKSRFLLLLTATPLQNNLEELHNLITLLKPGQLKTRAAFMREFVSKQDPTVPVNEEKLRELLSGVMIRNTRALAGLHLPPRHASTVTIDPSPAEKELYDRISTLVRTGYREDGQDKFHRLTLRLLQSEAGSSPRALLKTLEKLPQSEELQSLAKIARSLDTHTKLDALATHLQTTREKTIVFMTFRETLSFSAEDLRRRGLEVILFHGGMSPREKEAAIDAFRDGGRTLLTTEVGGEGRNLQFCRHMVNFDLPWNPMRIEQRIGRIHRIGQENEIEIVNLCARGSVEDHLLTILDKKINLFELVVGEVDLILGQLEDKREFSERVLEAWAAAETDEGAAVNFERLSRELEQAKEKYERIKSLDDSLFGDDYEV